jgi:hypothetical protein
VAPLRQLRRQLKGTGDPDIQGLRRRILGLELAAERRVQYRLATILRGEHPPGTQLDRFGLAVANLALYLGDEAGSPEARILGQTLAALMRRA